MSDPHDHPTWRKWAYRLLVTLFVIGLIGSTVAIWANIRVQESDAWANTVAPLADDPAVKDFVVDQAATVIESHIATDEDAGLLRSVSRSQMSGLLRSGLEEFVDSSTFTAWWTEANRTTHAVLMRVNDDNAGVLLQTNGGDLVLDLQPVLDWMNGNLEGIFTRTGFSIDLTPEQSVIVLYSSESLETITRAIDFVDWLSVVLPILTVICAVGAMLVARARMSALMQIGLAIIAGMIVVMFVLAVARFWIVSQQPESHRDVLDAVFRIVLADLMLAFRALTVLGMLLVARVLIVRWFIANRTRLAKSFRENRQAVVVAIMGLAILTLIAVNYPPLWLSIAMLAVIVLAAVFLLRWRNDSGYAGAIEEQPAEP